MAADRYDYVIHEITPGPGNADATVSPGFILPGVFVEETPEPPVPATTGNGTWYQMIEIEQEFDFDGRILTAEDLSGDDNHLGNAMLIDAVPPEPIAESRGTMVLPEVDDEVLVVFARPDADAFDLTF